MLLLAAIGMIAIALLGRFFFPTFSISLQAIILFQFSTNVLSSVGGNIYATVAWAFCLSFIVSAFVYDIMRLDELQKGKIRYYQ